MKVQAAYVTPGLDLDTFFFMSNGCLKMFNMGCDACFWEAGEFSLVYNQEEIQLG